MNPAFETIHEESLSDIEVYTERLRIMHRVIRLRLPFLLFACLSVPPTHGVASESISTTKSKVLIIGTRLQFVTPMTHFGP